VLYFRNETSPVFAVHVRDPNGYSISGQVAESAFSCQGAAGGVRLRLDPLGRVTTTGVADGAFAFDGVPPGTYTLVVEDCTPIACWPPIQVDVIGNDVSLQLCPALRCVADCDHDGFVHIEDLIRAVSAALAALPVSYCGSLDVNMDGAIEVEELILAVNQALNGCPG
jgi:hypothetical protein